jgi:cell division protease FtsH
MPHGRALGVTEQLPDGDRYNHSRNYLIARLAVMIAGRAAEEVATGGENDLLEANRLARRMVTRWGMGSLGLMALSTNDDRPFLGYEITQPHDISEETAALIDQDVQRLLNQAYSADRLLIEGDRERLDKLVKALLQEETIKQADLARILGPRGQPAEASVEIATAAIH